MTRDGNTQAAAGPAGRPPGKAAGTEGRILMEQGPAIPGQRKAKAAMAGDGRRNR